MKSQLHGRWQGIVKEWGGGAGWSSWENMVVYLQNICPQGQDTVRMAKWNLISNWSRGNAAQGVSTTGDTKQAELPHGTSENPRSKQQICRGKGTFEQARFTQRFVHLSWGVTKWDPSTCAALGSTGNDLNYKVLMNLLLNFSSLPLIIRRCRERHHWLIGVSCLFLKGDVKLPAVNNEQSSLQYFLDSDIMMMPYWNFYIIMQFF